ncbi:amino acid ABC transporter substrate-binding protein [Gordonibacter sp. 28C]|uniref:transporter substrate-binding domain-containing protein n=1 Tax=Gordonibacter sp. 28C TaxID=2078569 RepID=UPI000DF83F81|nr:transporter substrate-binding domain-containing protein [Gordonibacter sp. 28C]RDB63874.1 amino acid ABC transporter substrate-binding protein [Gordonibacter sp. 28C]
MGKAGMRRGVALLLAALALALALALAGLAGCGGDGGKEAAGNGKTLRVGVRSDVVGFGYLNEDTGKYYGLEIDIANEMAERLGYDDVEFVTVLPENRKDMLQNGDVDCLVACYSVAESREKNFDFSPAYYEDSSIVMVENSSLVAGIEGLKGKTIATMSGANTAPQLAQRLTDVGFTSGEVVSQTEDHAETVFDNFRLVQLDSYRDLSQALEEGTVDAACMDGSIAHTYLNDGRSILGFKIATQSYGVATQKDSPLSKPVSDAVQAMIDDGTVAELTDKWD